MVRSMGLRRVIGSLIVVLAILATASCNGNVYLGVGVAGPYGYPYGGYGPGPMYGGGVYVGRPFP